MDGATAASPVPLAPPDLSRPSASAPQTAPPLSPLDAAARVIVADLVAAASARVTADRALVSRIVAAASALDEQLESAEADQMRVTAGLTPKGGHDLDSAKLELIEAVEALPCVGKIRRVTAATAAPTSIALVPKFVPEPEPDVAAPPAPAAVPVPETEEEIAFESKPPSAPPQHLQERLPELYGKAARVRPNEKKVVIVCGRMAQPDQVKERCGNRVIMVMCVGNDVVDGDAKTRTVRKLLEDGLVAGLALVSDKIPRKVYIEFQGFAKKNGIPIVYPVTLCQDHLRAPLAMLADEIEKAS